MIAGRTRFYAVAGVAGATLGEVLAAGVALGLSWLVPATTTLGRPAALLYAGALIVLGLALGASAGVALLRAWYRAQDLVGTGASPLWRSRARPSRTPRPVRSARCTPAPATSHRVDCSNARGA